MTLFTGHTISSAYSIDGTGKDNWTNIFISETPHPGPASNHHDLDLNVGVA